jgi:alkanesulfonate monooxygenase SsuD/methylene tetrahydromethanopterin reductase-like flavin-dependent oxidoreductase (luciferase family)
MMSCSNEVSARVAAQKRAMFALANLQTFDNARSLIRVYKEEARACGWEPGPEDITISLTASVDDDVDLAKDRLTEGRRYFADVLGGGLRTAQQIVLQKTRYMDDETRSKFQGANKQAKISVDDLIDAGIIVCGTAEMAVAQIKRAHAELGMGNININMKVGNIPDTAIVNQIKIFGEQILPQVKNL